MNSRFLRNGIVTLVLVVGMATLLYILFFPSQPSETIPYAPATTGNTFLALVKQGKVAGVVQQGNKLQITLTEQLNGNAIVKESQVPGQLGTGLVADITAVCNQPDATCNPAMTIGAAEEPQTGQWLGVLLTTLCRCS